MATASQEDPPDRSGSRRVLLAHGDPAMLRLVEILLVSMDCVVRLASDPRQAAHALEHEIFDVVLLDAGFALTGGARLMRGLRALPEPRGDTPVVAFVEDADGAAAGRVRALGADACLAAPLDVTALTGLVELLARGGASRSAGIR